MQNEFRWKAALPINFSELQYDKQMLVIEEIQENLPNNYSYVAAYKNNLLPDELVKFLVKDPEIAIKLFHAKPSKPEFLITALQTTEAELRLTYSYEALEGYSYNLVSEIMSNKGCNDTVIEELKKYLQRIEDYIKRKNQEILDSWVSR